MISVVQRVTSASVTVADPPHHAEIAAGLCVLLAIEQSDHSRDVKWMAGKLANLRIFRDAEGKMNRSVKDVAGEILLISQFTLAGDCSTGNRPSFISAARPDVGRGLYEAVAKQLVTDHGVPVKTGVFGAMMAVQINNDGPVTLILNSPRRDGVEPT
ncbi:MAG TPA: D-aminoacyl-tRNA deacylase [Phycisphaerales bacterium]|nr:D-aminoacyl-tRNA deacylase [Phycisphaerales bacterium]